MLKVTKRNYIASFHADQHRSSKYLFIFPKGCVDDNLVIN
jgi:hypothetical protein